MDVRGARLNHLQSGGGGARRTALCGDKQERAARRLASRQQQKQQWKRKRSRDPGSCAGLFDAQVVPAAVRKDGKYTQDAQKIALARLTFSGVCFTCSGQQETQAASLSPIMYMYQR